MDQTVPADLNMITDHDIGMNDRAVCYGNMVSDYNKRPDVNLIASDKMLPDDDPGIDTVFFVKIGWFFRRIKKG